MYNRLHKKWIDKQWQQVSWSVGVRHAASNCHENLLKATFQLLVLVVNSLHPLFQDLGYFNTGIISGQS